jgi:hypothetical protein
VTEAPPAASPGVVPGPAEGRVRSAATAGTTFTVSGDGYAPGAEIHVSFGRYATDGSLLDNPVVYADANGHYSMPITLPADLKPGMYGVLVWYAPFAEDHKRFAIIDVAAP